MLPNLRMRPGRSHLLCGLPWLLYCGQAKWRGDNLSGSQHHSCHGKYGKLGWIWLEECCWTKYVTRARSNLWLITPNEFYFQQYSSLYWNYDTIDICLNLTFLSWLFVLSNNMNYAKYLLTNSNDSKFYFYFNTIKVTFFQLFDILELISG